MWQSALSSTEPVGRSFFICCCIWVSGTLMDCYDELGNRYQLPVYVLSAPINLLREGSGEMDVVPEDVTLPSGPGVEVPIKLHLSTGRDLRLTVCSTDTIAAVKRQIQTIAGIDARRLRIFFAGKQLVDRQRIDEVKIHRGYTLQVVVTEPSGAAVLTATAPASSVGKVNTASVTVSTLTEEGCVPSVNPAVTENRVPAEIQPCEGL